MTRLALRPCALLWVALLAFITLPTWAQTPILPMITTDTTTTPQPTIGKRVVLETTLGRIVLGLYDDTPKHRDNFVKLVSEQYYDSTLFHRVIMDFMVQGGDPDSRTATDTATLGEGDPGYTIEAEILPHLYHKRGALAAARTGDFVNPERRSSGSQFYIVWGRPVTPLVLERMAKQISMDLGREFAFPPEATDSYAAHGGTPHLDGQYTVFGEVLEGLEVVERMHIVETDRNDRPLQNIRIIKAYVE